MDALRNLRPIKWRGIPFPIANLRTEIQQDLAQHRMPDQDGARVEAMGRGPINISGRAMFRNVGTTFEPVSGDAAYPTLHRAFLDAMADRTTGELIHPELGAIRCKPVSAVSSISADIRDGADVECTWIETIDDEEIGAFASERSALADLPASSEEMDRARQALQSLNIKAANRRDETTFADMARSITRAAGTIGATSRKYSRIGSSIVKQINDIRSSLHLAGTTAVESAERLEAAVYAAAQTFGSKKIRSYIVPDGVVTLGALAVRLGMSPDELMRLNPHLVAAPRIERSALVRYYK